MITSKQAPAIADLHDLYVRRVPRMFYDYCETGSYTTSTFVDNTTAFAKFKIRQRVARNIDNRSTATTMLGENVAMPVALAPVGLTGMQHADHHEYLLDRRCGSKHHKAILVSALCHAGSCVFIATCGARQGRKMFGPGFDLGPSTVGATP
jgi:isopentenyl diphosphate isomerase/L-lactate dehydrogenase-like FMN-dependent dehydrogenase